MPSPRFPLTLDELRDIQSRRLDDADVRALLWEVKRLKNVIRMADEHRQVIEQAWRDEVGSHLVAIWQLRLLLSNEVGNLPASSDCAPVSGGPSHPSANHPSDE